MSLTSVAVDPNFLPSRRSGTWTAFDVSSAPAGKHSSSVGGATAGIDTARRRVAQRAADVACVTLGVATSGARKVASTTVTAIESTARVVVSA